MKKSMKVVAVLVTLFAWRSAMAATDGSNEMALNRMAKPLAVNIGLNNAGPAGIGLGASYSITPWMKAVAGYSEMKMTTSVSVDGNGNWTTGETKYVSYAGGAQFAIPDWNITPIAGLNVAHYSVTSNDGSEASFNGLSGKGTIFYTTVGMNWQSHSGFTTDLGFNIPLGNQTTSSAFVDLGWAWDIL